MSEPAGRTRARQVPVARNEPLIGDDRYDYADAFEIRIGESDPRTAEQFARCALEEAPWAIRTIVDVAHRQVLRLRLGPRPSPDHVFGWTIVRSEPDLVHLEAESPLLGRGAIVGRRVERTRVVITTYVFFSRPAPASVIWTFTAPLHRWVARYLLEHAAATPEGTRDTVAAVD